MHNSIRSLHFIGRNYSIVMMVIYRVRVLQQTKSRPLNAAITSGSPRAASTTHREQMHYSIAMGRVKVLLDLHAASQHRAFTTLLSAYRQCIAFYTQLKELWICQRTGFCALQQCFGLAALCLCGPALQTLAQ